jgi:hypothetical protein
LTGGCRLESEMMAAKAPSNVPSTRVARAAVSTAGSAA